jgi:hypothetical protein
VITIPSDVIITVAAGPLNGLRLIEAEYDGYLIYMFTKDIRSTRNSLPKRPQLRRTMPYRILLIEDNDGDVQLILSSLI